MTRHMSILSTCQCFKTTPTPLAMAKTKVGKSATRKEFGDGVMAEPNADEAVVVSPPESEAEGAQAKDKGKKRAFTKVTQEEKTFLEALLEEYDPRKASKRVQVILMLFESVGTSLLTTVSA